MIAQFVIFEPQKDGFSVMALFMREVAGRVARFSGFCIANSQFRLKSTCDFSARLSFKTLASVNSCSCISSSFRKSESSSSHRNTHCVVLTSVRFAGHSHWHNIRHTKESKDAIKQKTALDAVRKIKLAVREGGGSTNPKLNSRLARALEDGKSKDVSNVTMMDVLKRMEKGKDLKGAAVFIEAIGIGNSLLVIEAFTDRQKWLRQEVQHVMKQFGGRIGEAGTSAHGFTFKGIVYLPKDQEKPLSEDEALEVAIEVGAEEVSQGQNDYKQDCLQLICDPKQLHNVKKALEGRGFKPETARLEYIPHSFTKLDEVGLGIASRMLDSLEALDEVVRVYDNIES